MSRNRHTPEQIISMLREAEVALAQGQSGGQALPIRFTPIPTRARMGANRI